MDDERFAGLIARARAGDDEAARTLLGAFEAEVRMMVRVRLPRALRGQFDSMDFVQAIWQSVFVGDGLEGGQYATAGQFRGFLQGVARNKVLEEYRRRTRTRKYDLAREEPLYVRRGDHEAPRDLAATDPTPSQEAQAGDCWERLLAGSPTEARIVQLRREGLTFEEIAERVGLHERAVRRALETVRKRLEDWR
jgi:RNA polymerase sigma factor (sigma-70 family)